MSDQPPPPDLFGEDPARADPLAEGPHAGADPTRRWSPHGYGAASPVPPYVPHDDPPQRPPVVPPRVAPIPPYVGDPAAGGPAVGPPYAGDPPYAGPWQPDPWAPDHPQSGAILAVGIATLVGTFLCVVPGLGGLYSLIAGRRVRREIRDAGGSVRGDGKVVAGMVCGGIAFGISLLVCLAVLISATVFLSFAPAP
ncbi:MAG: hypothetical protein ABI746_05960 [Dermatophilaceae bacterium]